MSNGGKGPWKGKSRHNFDAAVKKAWDEAKKDGQEKGTYKVEFEIDAENPITSYIATISKS